MDMDSFLVAMESILLNVSKLSPTEVVENFQQVHKVFVRMSSMLTDMDMFDSALKFQEHFLQLCEQLDIGSTHPNIYSYAINDLAETYYNMGKKSQSKRYYEQNIKFNERLKRSGGATVSTLLDLQLAYGKLALVHATSQESGAIQATSAAVLKLLQLQQGVISQLSERSDCKPSKQVIATVSAVNTLLEMAHLCLNGGDLEAGLSFFDKAKKIALEFKTLDAALKTSRATSDDPESDNDIPTLEDTLDSIELGRTSFLTRMGRFEEAYAEANVILERQRARLDSESPLLIATYNNLGHILSSLGRYAEAEEQLWKAVELVLKHRGEESVEIYGERLYHMQSLLSNVLKVQNKLREAVEVQEANVKLSAQLYGEVSRQSVESLYYLAIFLIDYKQYSQAFSSMAEAYNKARSGAINAKHPISLPLARAYATLLFGGNPSMPTQGSSAYAFTRPTQVHPLQSAVPMNLEEGERIILETQNAFNAAYGPKSRRAAVCAMTMGQVYEEAAGNANKASFKYRSALDIFLALPQSSLRDSSIISAQLAMARTLSADRRFTEAKPYLDEALATSRVMALDAASRMHRSKSQSDQTATQHIALAVQSYLASSQWYHHTNQLKKSLLAAGDGIALGQPSLGADHPQILNLGLHVAHVLITSGNTSEATNTLNGLLHVVSSSTTLTKSQKKIMTDKINTKISHAQQASSSAEQGLKSAKHTRTRVTPLN